MAKASPDVYRLTVQKQQALPNGQVIGLTDTVIPDGDTATQMRHQFIGNQKGLSHLSRFLTERKLELQQQIAKLDENERTK